MDVKLQTCPLVSIIIPVYNTAPYLKRCLDSVVGQTYENLEIILIDDGSTDESIHILREYQNKDARIHILEQENKGQSAARNAGLDIARGGWVVFVDSDDEASRDMVEVLLGAVLREKAEIGAGAYWLYDEGSGSQSLCHISQGVYRGKESFGKIFCLDGFMIVCACIFQRDIFERHRFPAGRICEDTYLIAHALCDVSTSVSVDIPIYFYHQRPDASARGITAARRVYDQFFVWQEIKSYIKEAAPEYMDDVLRQIRGTSFSPFFRMDNKCRMEQLETLDEVKACIAEKIPEHTSDFQGYLFGIFCQFFDWIAEKPEDFQMLEKLKDYTVKEIPEYAVGLRSKALGACRWILSRIDRELCTGQLPILKEIAQYLEREQDTGIEDMDSIWEYFFWICYNFLCWIEALGRKNHLEAWEDAAEIFSIVKGEKWKKSFSCKAVIYIFNFSPILLVKVQNVIRHTGLLKRIR